MKRLSPDETRCVFRVRCATAQQVRLVIERRYGASQIFPLEPLGQGLWETVLNLRPGEYRYCYHAYNGRTLTYLTPPGAVLDGLKALLCLGAADQTDEGDAGAREHEPAARLALERSESELAAAAPAARL